jgi:hypothetical protein
MTPEDIRKIYHTEDAATDEEARARPHRRRAPTRIRRGGCS